MTRMLEADAGGDSMESVEARIESLVREYFRSHHASRPFEPGVSSVPYAGRVFGEDELVNGVRSLLDFWLTLGPWGKRFERGLRAYLGSGPVVLANSGSSANLIAVGALLSKTIEGHLSPGDEVITLAAGFPTTVNAIVFHHLTPVFIDVEPQTFVPSAEMVEQAIGPRTRAAVLTHTLGNPFPATEISELCKKHSLFLIEDNCDALGSIYKGQKTGTFGHLGSQSFYPPHHLTMGEGGAVVCNDRRFKRVALSLRDWGRDCWCESGHDNTCGRRFQWQLGDLPRGYDHKYIYSHLGFNLKPIDVQAAIGVAQLARLPGFVADRKRNWQYLRESLSEFDEFLELPEASPGSEPSWFGFMILVRESAPFSRDDLVEYLEQHKIHTRMHFGGNLTKQPAYADVNFRVIGDLETSDQMMMRGFFIGVYPGLSQEQLAYVTDVFSVFFKQNVRGRADEPQKTAGLVKIEFEHEINRASIEASPFCASKTSEVEQLGVRLLSCGRFEDSRGALVKIATRDDVQPAGVEFGEIYVSTAEPGQMKGAHYHQRTTEWFSILDGETTLFVRKAPGTWHTQLFSADEPVLIMVPPGVSHAFLATGASQLKILAYSNIEFDPADPDSIEDIPNDEVVGDFCDR